MKKIMTLILSLALTLAFSGMAMAGMDAKCMVCHKDGNTMKAPTEAQMLEKHKTAAAFVAAGMASKSPLMKAFQKEDALKAAATALGLK